eukprot:scaffold2179_cov134-Pinguiococcus_pyrenoidosus.AAC.1
MSLAASGASLRRSGCHFRRSERYAVRILSSVAPSWTPRISYADCPSVVAEFLTRNAMVCERGESARVEEEEQRVRAPFVRGAVPANGFPLRLGGNCKYAAMVRKTETKLPSHPLVLAFL